MSCIMEDYKIKDPALATLGRQEIGLAEQEMPGLMSIREKWGAEKPLTGARIGGCLHMTVQTAVLIETLQFLGACVRWCGSNIFSTQDTAAAAIARAGTPVFAWKGQSQEDYYWCLQQVVEKQNWRPHLFVDDGAEIVSYLLQHRPSAFTKLHGVCEQTGAGIVRLSKIAQEGKLLTPVININDSVTKSKFDNIYGTRESLLDGLKRATDTMIAGKIAVVCGYGHVGKGAALALRGQGARVVITEIDPICALQAAMEGLEVTTMDKIASKADIFVTATGNIEVITFDHLSQMKQGAIVCNIGHLDKEIAIAALQDTPWIEITPQLHQVRVPNGNSIRILAKGRIVNLACATGHSSFVMSASLSNQVLGVLELWKNQKAYKEKKIYTLPKALDEWIASVHLTALGGQLTKLSKQQAHYLNVSPQGPFKDNTYRY